MPSHLVPQNPDFFDKWVEDAEEARPTAQIRIGSPWVGLTPDLDPNQSAVSGMTATSVGLVARPGPAGAGEVLMPDAGFTQVDGANLPLVTDDQPGDEAAIEGNTNIGMLAQFDRTTPAGAQTSGTEYDGPTMLALITGDGSNPGSSELWRVKPSDGAWEQIVYETVGTDAPLEPEADRESMSDWAQFPAGAPTRGDYTGAITEPVFVWCNLQDNVMVYPNTTGESEQFEPLVEDSFNGTFKAKTVEHFGGRLYFGNTFEDATHHRQRIRRTALFTADVDPTLPGAGAFDIRDFAGDLLRLEKMGDMMVAYFTDGTAFIRLSDVATSPDRVQLLREKRGLLATHAMCSVGNQEHFGIFDDGWFFLDPSGRWTEVGMQNIEGKQIPLWKETFYNMVDMDYRHRMVVNYDGRYIRIAFTAKTTVDPEHEDFVDRDNQEVWIFDPRGNRVFRDTYPVTCWAEANANIREAVNWDDLTTSWSDLEGSWLSLAAKFSLKNLNHGTTAGYVLVHDYDIITKFNIETGKTQRPSFVFNGVLSSLGDPTELKTALKLWLEYIHTGEGSVVLEVSGNPSDGGESGRISYSTLANAGDIELLFRTFRFTAANIRFSISGTAPVMVRSVLADIAVKGTQTGDYASAPTGGRRGQT